MEFDEEYIFQLFTNLITNYNDANNGGLAYYYQNSAAIMNEVNTLSGYLDEMLAETQK